MKKNKNAAERFLGEVESVIAGAQYHEARAKPGEDVYLEREPDNTHDGNAVRVENCDSENVGYLPRRVAVWLAPLIDTGRVVADAYVPDVLHRPNGMPALNLKLYLSPKGAGFMAPQDMPATLQQAVHEVILNAYTRCAGWGDPSVVTGLAGRLEALSKHDILPETKLLLSLFPNQARAIEERKWTDVVQLAQAAVGKVNLGPSLHHRNLTLLPLVVSNGHEPGYVLLQDALGAGSAEVLETSEQGCVPELLVANRASRPILIPEGEILTGEKQNRVVNITVLVAAHTEFVLPVSCVEQGRWSRVSHGFQATHFAPPGVRARKNAGVRESRLRSGEARSDQGQVWDDVASCLRQADAMSSTASLIDGYEAAGDRVKQYRDKLVLPDGAAGVLVACGERVLGMDLFDTPKTFQALWPRLSEAYFFEAAVREGLCRKTTKSQAKGFLDSLPARFQPVKGHPGIGTALELTGDDLAGAALWHDQRICHLAAHTLGK
jgi:ARG and Rhodanese-Phosphatase-superfamily-associated Protein domain/HIRAN domain